MSQYRIDFRALKQRASFQIILDRYGLTRRGSGRRHFILCPLHQEREPSCLIDHGRNRFHCFGCGEHGSILDFVARLENCTVARAAEIVSERCGIAPRDEETPGKEADAVRGVRKETTSTAPAIPHNPPLQWRLQLDPSHPYLAVRGVRPDIIEQFGLGFCDRGMMRGRIGIPIHDEAGQLIAYAGRWAEKDVPEGRPRYLLPRGFHKQLVLFNLHRVKGARALTIVESYWSVFRLAALGVPAVALMGRDLSAAQRELLTAAGVRYVHVMLDGDQPGRSAAAQMATQLAGHMFVRNIELRNSMKPHSAPGALLCYLLGLS